MRKQKGCIRAHGNWWTVLYRENGKLQSKQLREITPEDRKNRDRKTGKLRIPRDVEDLAREHMNLVNRAAGRPGRVASTLTIGELVEQKYLPDLESAWKQSSIDNYRCLWNKYLKPKISRHIVRDFLREDAFLLFEAIHKENPHLRRRSMGQIKSVLRNVFSWAADRGMCDSNRVNPASAALPSGLPANKETQAYTMDEISTILRLCIDPKMAAVFALFFGSGNRRDEVRGLCWEHYERREDGAVLKIAQQFGRFGLQTPKTASSTGTIELGEAFCRYIDAYRATLPQGADSGWMFPGRTAAKPMDMGGYSKSHIEPFLKSAGIPYKGGFHAFRRGNSTFVAKALNSEAAAALLRHTPEMAEAHYIKANEQERRGAQAAKIASIESKRAELRKAAAQSLNAGLEQVQ